MPTAPPRKRESLSLRIKPEERSLLDRAAKARGKNRTDFVQDAAREAAEEVLLGQSLMAVSPAAYAAFVARLDMPAQPNERLQKTMRMRPPWDEK
jgi:uncharacterized protein (DUF1778 family)